MKNKVQIESSKGDYNPVGDFCRKVIKKMKRIIFFLMMICFCITACSNFQEKSLEQTVDKFSKENDVEENNVEGNDVEGNDVEQKVDESDNDLGNGLNEEIQNKHATLDDVNRINLNDISKEYISLYYNDGYQVQAIRNIDGNYMVYIYYKDLVWDTEIALSSSYNVGISVFGENAYITYFSFDDMGMYKFNLNTYEYESLLDNSDFEEYIYRSTSIATWSPIVLKTDSKIYMIGAASEWYNVLEYNIQDENQGIIYKGKLVDENNEVWYLRHFFSEDKINLIYEGADKYLIIGSEWVDAEESGVKYYSMELQLESCKIGNKVQSPVFESDEYDIFVGKHNGEMVIFSLLECEREDNITGQIERSVMLRKTDFNNGTEVDLFELPQYIYGAYEIYLSKITENKIIFGKKGEGLSSYVIDLERKNIFSGGKLEGAGYWGFRRDLGDEGFFDYESLPCL